MASRRYCNGTTTGTAWMPAPCCTPTRPSWPRPLPACGKRWSIIPAGATEPYLRMFSNVQVLRLAHPPAERTFYLVTPKGRALSAAAETLLEDLRVQIQDLEGITWY